MKNKIIFIPLLFAAVSCSEPEIDQPTQGTTSDPIVLSASTAEGTRVGFEDQDGLGVKVTWAENDELSFYDAEGQLVGDFRLLESSVGQTKGAFEQVGEFTLTEGAKYTVVYPKVDGATSLALYNRILSVQTQDDNAPMSHMDKLMRMEKKEYIYRAVDPRSIVFSHSYAMMTLTLSTPENYAVQTDGTPKEMILYVGGVAYNLSLKNIAWDSAIKAYVMIEPTTSAAGKVRVEVITTTDKVYTTSFEASTVYTAGKRYFKTLAPALVTSYTLATIHTLPTTATEVVVTDVIDEATDVSALKTALNTLAESTATLILPNATGIGAEALKDCLSLTSVSLPKVTTIGTRAFSGCFSLTSVSLPAATTIGDGALSGCRFTSVSLPKAETIGVEAFYSCMVMTSVSLPVAATIGEGAFAICDALTSVSLPMATTIGTDAFAMCRHLPSVSLPAVIEIGESAFDGCYALTSVSLPEATTIGPKAFSSCDALTSMSLPKVETIGVSVFNNCAALTSVSLPVATSIGKEAFSGCGLTSVSLPKVETIGDHAFSYCKSLISLNFPAATELGSSAFHECTALASVSLPEAATIGPQAFSRCGLTSVSLPKAETIGERAFSDCAALTSVNLPKATSIGDYAFIRIGTADSVTSGTIAIAAETTDDVTTTSTNIFEYTSTAKYDLEVGPGVTGIDVDAKTWTLNGTVYTFKSITVKQN